MRLINYFLLL